MIAYAGIDISKESLQVALYPLSENLSVPNTAEGAARILDWFAGIQVERVLVEATGGYEKRV
ncbi:IS110 family transposase, partial [Pseudomonas mendocina]|nr:IS110 family transposase [Pseudomonas mendocina]